MKKHLSRLLIAGEVVVLIGILLIGLVGGIGTLGSYLFEKVSAWRTTQAEKTADNTETGKKVTINWPGSKKEAEDTSAEETAETETLAVTEAEAEAVTEEETDTVTEVVSADVKAVYTEQKITFSSEVEAAISAMTPEQLAGQVFMVNTDQLMNIYDANKAGSTTESYYKKYPAGGIVLNKDNFKYTVQVVEFTNGLQKFSEAYAGTSLFIMTREDGSTTGTVVADMEGLAQPESPKSLGSQDTSAVAEAAKTKASYLTDAGFNMNIGTMTSLAGDDTSFGTDASKVSELIKADISGMKEGGVISVVCTFPWADTRNDTSSFADLMAGDLSVFRAAVDGGAEVIMVGDDTVSAISGSDPCLLSTGTADVLRGNLGYEGILMTCPLSDSSLKDQDSGEVAVKAINAGMDMIYSPSNMDSAYQTVLAAIKDGSISETRIHNAVGRILTAKAGL